jgi:hypothetical protein
MNRIEKFEEIAKACKYLEQAETALENIRLIPRRGYFHCFDTIAMALLSKAFSVARACIILLEHDFEDEAYAMCRSVVECGWTFRYLTETRQHRARAALCE